MVASETKLNRIAVAGAIAALAALGVTAPQALSQNRIIQIDGSSTVFPISEAMAEEFMAANRGSQVVVGVSGTGGGFRRFCAGETDISNASRPIRDSEKEACAAAGVEFIEIPVAFDALTVVVNPANTWAREMTVEQLKMLWEPAAQGTITRWNQIDPSWPNQPISLFGPGTDSGTFDYFTEEIMGKVGESRADYTASEDDNILVVGVERDRYALGYFGMSYYLENRGRLRSVAIDGVEATPENVENGTYTPLSRPLFLYVSRDSLQRPEVRSFVQFYLSNAEEIVPDVGYVPLPSVQYSQNLGSL
jgi:phosphate transport system substrate-binding protein